MCRSSSSLLHSLNRDFIQLCDCKPHLLKLPFFSFSLSLPVEKTVNSEALLSVILVAVTNFVFVYSWFRSVLCATTKCVRLWL